MVYRNENYKIFIPVHLEQIPLGTNKAGYQQTLTLCVMITHIKPTFVNSWRNNNEFKNHKQQQSN